MKGLPLAMTAQSPSSLEGWSGESPWFSRGGFLFDPVSGLTYTLNNCGALVYEKLRAGDGLDEILRAITSRFEVDEMVARLDLQEFMQQMRALGLHETRPGSVR